MWTLRRSRAARPATLCTAGRDRMPLDERPELGGDVVGGDDSEDLTVEAKTNARSASHSRAALSASVSKTGWRSKVERPITLSSSLVAVCCSSVTRSSLFRSSSSLNSRTFSTAMTAWSAKVLGAGPALSLKGPGLDAADEDDADDLPLAQHRNPEAPTPAARPRRVLHRIRRIRQDVRDVTTARSRKTRAAWARRPAASGKPAARPPCLPRSRHGARRAGAACRRSGRRRRPRPRRASRRARRWCRTRAGRRSATG